MAVAPDVVPQIALNHISFRYGKYPALDDVSLAIGAGEIMAVVGPSGCGKSTLMRIIAGLATPKSGTLSIAGQLMFDGSGHNIPAEKRGVGLVFQDYALFPHLTAAKNIGFGLSRLTRSPRKERVEAMLALVGLGNMGARYPHELSGGQQQRVALARALAPEPAVLLMDEPFSGLDAQTRGRVRDQVLGVLRQTATTALIVTHDPDEAMQVGDRLVVMNQGRLAQLGTAGQVYQQPNSAFVGKLFGDINVLPHHLDGLSVVLPGDVRHPDPWGHDTPPLALIRPEKLRVTSVDAGKFVGEVTDCRTIGPDVVITVTIDVAGQHHSVLIKNNNPPSPAAVVGDKVGIDYNPLDVHLVVE
ncbi:MAG: ABC transporter ATP-binding protein [Pseudomonadota bacterium]